MSASLPGYAPGGGTTTTTGLADPRAPKPAFAAAEQPEEEEIDVDAENARFMAEMAARRAAAAGGPPCARPPPAAPAPPSKKAKGSSKKSAAAAIPGVSEIVVPGSLSVFEHPAPSAAVVDGAKSTETLSVHGTRIISSQRAKPPERAFKGGVVREFVNLDVVNTTGEETLEYLRYGDCVLKLRKGTSFSVADFAGLVYVNGVFGTVRADSSLGRVEIAAGSEVKLADVSMRAGSVYVGGRADKVVVSGMSTAVELQGNLLSVEVLTINGLIRLRGFVQKTRVTTRVGTIHYEAKARDKVVLRSMSGNIILVDSRTEDEFVDARSERGHVLKRT